MTIRDRNIKRDADIASTKLEASADLTIIANIPTADQEDSSTIWNDNGTLKVSTSGA